MTEQPISTHLDNIAQALSSVAKILKLREAQQGAQPLPIEEKPEKSKVATPSLEDVRKKLTALSRAGHKKEVRELLASYKVKRLSDVPEDKRAELLAKAGEIA